MPHSSYRMFGLNSMLLPRSHSTTSLQQTSPQSNKFQYKFAHAATETALPHPALRQPTQASLLDTPDDTITALPPPRAPPRGRSIRRLGRRHEQTVTPSQSPKEEKKKSAWFRVKKSVKATFQRISFPKRKKKEEVRPGMVIGPPTDVQQVAGHSMVLGNTMCGRVSDVSEESDADWEDVNESRNFL